MCGVIGFWDPFLQHDSKYLEFVIQKMSSTLNHRGPDDHGYWVDETSGLALGFRRLAVLDLTPAGHQPMISQDGRYVMVYNGEVYNFNDLRRELLLLGHSFRSHSDSEVMLAAFCQWGVISAVKRFNGMFAIALWDTQEKRLYLIRDRIGIKPLYYGRLDGVFAFGSELKALRAHPAFQAEINRDALALLLRHNYISAPYSIYKGIFKLKPASILEIDAVAGSERLVPYWSAWDTAEKGRAQPFKGSDEEAVEELDALLRESIRLRMVADVPLGAFLSGGIDSSTVTALMQAQSSIPVKTFTVGFWEKAYDEARYAKIVANHLGTDHTELYVTPQEALEVIPRLPELYDEPYSDSSQIPTFLVAQMARRHVTVSLSADGGDELFGGYTRYTFAHRAWRRLEKLPYRVRRGLLVLLGMPPDEFWHGFQQVLMPVLPRGMKQSLVAEKIHKMRSVLLCQDEKDVYRRLVTHWMNPEEVVIGAQELPTPVSDPSQWPQIADPVEWMMALDLVSYLPDDILVKVDRASMGVSLEARVPLLDDHRVVEFAWRLPLSMKIRNGQSKWLLRQVLKRYVPPEMVDRPKMGFAIPISQWLRGPLRDWAETLLDESRLRQEGYFDPGPIRRLWSACLAGKGNWHYDLWDVLMFQAWLDSLKLMVSL